MEIVDLAVYVPYTNKVNLIIKTWICMIKLIIVITIIKKFAIQLKQYEFIQIIGIIYIRKSLWTYTLFMIMM